MDDAHMIGHVSRSALSLARAIVDESADHAMFAWIDSLGMVWVSDVDPGGAAAVRIGCYRSPGDVLEDVYAAGAEFSALVDAPPPRRRRPQ